MLLVIGSTTAASTRSSVEPGPRSDDFGHGDISPMHQLPATAESGFGQDAAIIGNGKIRRIKVSCDAPEMPIFLINTPAQERQGELPQGHDHEERKNAGR